LPDRSAPWRNGRVRLGAQKGARTNGEDEASPRLLPYMLRDRLQERCLGGRCSRPPVQESVSRGISLSNNALTHGAYCFRHSPLILVGPESRSGFRETPNAATVSSFSLLCLRRLGLCRCLGSCVGVSLSLVLGAYTAKAFAWRMPLPLSSSFIGVWQQMACNSFTYESFPGARPLVLQYDAPSRRKYVVEHRVHLGARAPGAAAAQAARWSASRRREAVS